MPLCVLIRADYIELVVQTHLRSHAAALGFQEVFGNPHQEGILMAACKEVSSNVHNQYGKSVHHSS